MSKKTAILLHLAIWVVLFLSPLFFLGHISEINPKQFLMVSLAPLTTMVVFYVNYLWLTPHYFVKGEKRIYWLVNVVLVVGLGIALHCWMSYTHSLFDDDRPRFDPGGLDVLTFMMRDIFQLVIAAATATAIQLAVRWQHSEAARVEAEAARAEAELKNLRWQMNPHFLLNTLNNIYALTAIDTTRAQESIQELSRLLRHVLYDNQLPAVPLHDEVEFMRNYVELMKIRLPKSVDVQFSARCTATNAEIAPLIFISLIENAFKHGVSPTQPSFIHITIEGDQHRIVCDISNSNYPKTETDHSGHGIGLSQVQRRLNLDYRDRYSWEHGVSPDGKTYHSRIQINQ